MIKGQTKKVFFNIRLNQQKPYDDRLQLSSLTNLAAELPLAERYAGLMFWVLDIQALYWFEADLTTPLPFFASVSSSVILGIEVADQDYTNLTAVLNATGPSLGSVVYVDPLGVAFVWDGSSWKYAWGTYTADTAAELLAIPAGLLKPSSPARVLGNPMVIDDLGGVSSLVTVVSSLPGSLHSGYYLVNGSLYVAVGGTAYRINDKTYVANIGLGIGTTNINHALNTPYVRGVCWITSLNELVPLPLKYVNDNNSTVDSRVAVSGTVVVFAEN
jgi:hypothetical protein